MSHERSDNKSEAVTRRKPKDLISGSRSIIKRGVADARHIQRSSKIRILLVCADFDEKEFIEEMVSTQQDMKIAASLGSPLEAVAMYKEVQPDIVVADIHFGIAPWLPSQNGIVMTRLLTDIHQNAKVILLGYPEWETVLRRALYGGARKVVDRFMDVAEARRSLLQEIRSVHMGGEPPLPFWRLPKGIDVYYFSRRVWDGPDTRITWMHGSTDVGLGYQLSTEDEQWNSLDPQDIHDYLIRKYHAFDQWKDVIQREDSISMLSRDHLGFLDLSLKGISYQLDATLRIFHNLEALNLGKCSLSKDDVSAIRSLDSLKKLWLAGAVLEADAIDALRGSESLQMLVLDGVQLANGDLDFLSDLPKLTHLSLRGHSLDAKVTSTIGSLPRLEVLRT